MKHLTIYYKFNYLIYINKILNKIFKKYLIKNELNIFI